MSDTTTTPQPPATPIFEANSREGMRDLLNSKMHESKRDDTVRTRDLSSAYERAYDQRPEVSERLSNAMLPVVGDVVYLYDRPGETATVLSVSEMARSMTVATSDGLTLDVPFKYATKAIRMEDKESGQMKTRFAINVGEILAEQRAQAAASAAPEPISWTLGAYMTRRSTSDGPPSLPPIVGTIHEGAEPAAPVVVSNGMERLRQHKRFGRFFRESTQPPSDPTPAPAVQEECGAKTKKKVRKEDLESASTQVSEGLSKASDLMRSTLRASLASKLLKTA